MNYKTLSREINLPSCRQSPRPVLRVLCFLLASVLSVAISGCESMSMATPTVTPLTPAEEDYFKTVAEFRDYSLCDLSKALAEVDPPPSPDLATWHVTLVNKANKACHAFKYGSPIEILEAGTDFEEFWPLTLRYWDQYQIERGAQPILSATQEAAQ